MKGMIYCPHRIDPPVNLMDNSWFIPRYLVNQRGQASYTTSWGRTIDRWYLSGSDSNPATMTLTEDGIQISCESSFLQQRILNPDVTKPHTAGFCIDGDIVCMHYSPAYVQNEVRLYGFFPITLNNIPNGATIRWAALYEGTYTCDNFPPPTPHPYSVVLAECRRWYLPLDASKWYEVVYPFGDKPRLEVLGDFARTPTLIGTPRMFFHDGVWHDMTTGAAQLFLDRCVFRFEGYDGLTRGSAYVVTGVSGVSCEI